LNRHKRWKLELDHKNLNESLMITLSPGKTLGISNLNYFNLISFFDSQHDKDASALKLGIEI
jgi:hypothetical protein